MANKIMRKVFLACAIIISIVYVSMYYDNGEYTKGNIDKYVRFAKSIMSRDFL